MFSKFTRLKSLVSVKSFKRNVSVVGDSSRSHIYQESLDNSEVDTVSQLVDRYFHVSTMQEQVLVIQPFIRFGQLAKADTDKDLMLNESIALVQTLNWKIVDHLTVGLSSFQKKQLFGRGKIKMLEIGRAHV